MKIGYPCINRSIKCTANSTFRIAAYSSELLESTVSKNLECLEKILHYNLDKGILFFRIGSKLVPFASHSVCSFDWVGRFKQEFARIGSYIRKYGMRISMHPDQFVLLNSPDPKTVSKSIKELMYHCTVLDLMGLPVSNKVQLHCGGIYGNREAAIGRLVTVIRKLPQKVTQRLVLENDDKCYSVSDCLLVNRLTGVPILLDFFHHECLNYGETNEEVLRACAATWKKQDGSPMVDYSQQRPGARRGAHSETLCCQQFTKTLQLCLKYNCDIMLEIKDKEASAIKAVSMLHPDYS